MRIAIALLISLGAAATPAVAQQTAPDRAQWAKAIERQFLRQGVDLTAQALETHQNAGAGREKRNDFPQLFLFGDFGRPFVFNSIAAGDVLATARSFGFRSIDFHSRTDGHWTYEIAGNGPLPPCDRMKRLCH